MKNSTYRFFFFAGLASLAGFLISYLAGAEAITGPFLIVFFVLMGIGVKAYDRIKGLSFASFIFAGVTLAMYYPQYFQTIGDFKFSSLIVPLIQIIMFGMGSQLSVRDFAGVLKMPHGIFVGILGQFTIMPFLGFGLATVFGFPPEVAAGMVLIGSSPSGLASNVMAYVARANVALSVTLTTVTTLLAPFATPAMMKLLGGQFIEVNFWTMMLDIINMVILPIIAGLIFNLFSATERESTKNITIQMVSFCAIIVLKNFLAFQTGNGVTGQMFLSGLMWNLLLAVVVPIVLALIFRSVAKGNKEIVDNLTAIISMVGIAVIIVVITASGRDSLLEIGMLLILATLLHNLGGYLLGYWACRLIGMKESDCRTISLEVGMQNGGLASGLALQMGKVATVGLAPLVFSSMMNITGSTLATWWRDRIPKEEVQK